MIKLLSYLLIFPIWGYQKIISPFFPSTCRFNPTCSNYAIEAIKKKGPFKGFWLALKEFQNVILGEGQVVTQYYKLFLCLK